MNININLGVDKLLKTVSNGIGKLYEPCHIQRIAESRAKEINILSEAISSCDMPVVYHSNGLHIDNRYSNEVAERVLKRVLNDEIRKQHIIDSIVLDAYKKLEHVTEVDSKPVDPNWTKHFFDSVGSVSDEELKKIWVEVLAGEIQHPESYSLRALNILRSMTKFDINAFKKLSSLAFIVQDVPLFFYNRTLLNKYEITMAEISALQECGILSYSMSEYRNLPDTNIGMCIHNYEIIGVIKQKKNEAMDFNFPILQITFSGYQLLNAVSCQYNTDYMIDSLKLLKTFNPGYTVTAHKITGFSVKGIRYNGKNDLLIMNERNEV